MGWYQGREASVAPHDGTTTGIQARAGELSILVATRRYGDVGDGVNASAWQTTGGALSTAPFAAVAWIEGGSRLGTAGVTAWAACAAVALCGVVAGVAFNRGIGRVPAVRAGQLPNLAPVVGTGTSVAFLGERPTTLQSVVAVTSSSFPAGRDVFRGTTPEPLGVELCRSPGSRESPDRFGRLAALPVSAHRGVAPWAGALIRPPGWGRTRAGTWRPRYAPPGAVRRRTHGGCPSASAPPSAPPATT